MMARGQLRRSKVLKLAGILGLIISCGLLGISKTVNIQKRIELLEDYYEMIMELKGQINYFKEPLPDLFVKIGKNRHTAAFTFISELGVTIQNKGAYMRDFWAKKVKCIYQDTPVTKEDMDIMSYLGEFIGQTDYNNQIQHFEYIERKLNNQIRLIKTELANKGPMYNKIGFFIGSIIGVLLI